MAEASKTGNVIRLSTPSLKFDQSSISVEKSRITGGGGSSVDTETKNYVDANMRAVKAENNASFSRLEGEIDHIPTPPSIWQIAGVVVAGIGALVAIAAFSSDRFDGGIAANAVVDSAISRLAAEQSERDARQDARLEQILKAVESQKAEHGTVQQGQD